MCNDYEQHVRYAEYLRALEEQGLAAPDHQGEADLPRADDIRIGDFGPVIRAEGEGGVALSAMRFGFPPPAGQGSKKKGAPVFNFRSEGRSFVQSRRCLIPASAFFEFTGRKYPKAKHRFTLKDAPFLCIAGLWREAGGEGEEKSNQPPAFTMLTTAPGPDVAPIHDRQVVVLRPQDWRHWLDLTKPEADLLRPLPARSLHVEEVRSGSD
ncbi:putative SOS response-associated peptidase YedK [Pseudorhizobium tarimense]|uniref:Abasic site processing protein n=1 Tax=Pseudorhizobium tarimense TaxID=1079109 RepID=A0ABV2HD25_9HYPH|nr:SOS response-associated peptidase [Pseudorhizobium tarimense]MCJ8521227.1 SOS response-associated peptidase [Pseudorhizobium tarimense]